MFLVIQPLKKYLTEHESETLSTCHDKYLASCQDAQRPLSKTASLPDGKCILLLYLALLSTVQILPIITRLAMVEPELGEYNIMLFWLKPNGNLAIPESEMTPQRQAPILRGGVTTVSYLLDTSYFPHCLMAKSNIQYGVCMISANPAAIGRIVGYHLFGFTLMYAYDSQ